MRGLKHPYDEGLPTRRQPTRWRPCLGELLRQRRSQAPAIAVPPILSAADVPDPCKPTAESLRREQVRMAVCPGEVGLGSVCVYAGEKALRDVTL